MQKLKLKALNLGAEEMLTRAQLKNVLGGDTNVTTTKDYCAGLNAYQCLVQHTGCVYETGTEKCYKFVVPPPPKP